MLRLLLSGLVLLLCLVGACCAWAEKTGENGADLLPGPAIDQPLLSGPMLPDGQRGTTQTAREPGPEQFRTEPMLGETLSDTASGPDVYLLPDRAGKLHKVLGFRYEDFLADWRARQVGETAAQIPPYAMQSVNLEGQVVQHESQGPSVRLRITMNLQVESGKPVGVVLQLGTLIIEHYNLSRDESQQENGRVPDDRHEFLKFDSERNRYVAWLQDDRNERGEQGGPSERRTIHIEGLVPLKATGGGFHLQLALPSAVKSELKLHVPEPQASGQVPHGHLLTTKAGPSGGTDFLIEGMVGECNLHWRSFSQLAEGRRAMALVEDEISVKIDLQGVRYDALLHMDNLLDTSRPMPGAQAEEDRFQIRLPPGCHLVNGTSSPDYELVPSIDNTINNTINSTLSNLLSSALSGKGSLSGKGAFTRKEKLPQERKVVEVRLRPGRQKPGTIHLVAERLFDDDQSERSVDVSGFELVGAVRQSGFVALEWDEQLQGYFDLEGAIRQTDIKDLPERLRQQTPIAAFSHARSRWQLRLHTVVQEPQIRVRPNYELELSEGSSRLRVQLDYQYTGARPYLLRIDMRGWMRTDDPLESGGAVDRNRSFETNQGLLVLRMVKSDSRQIKIRFSARRQAEQSAAQWPLPVPLGAFVLPGNFSVRSQSSLLVTPQNSQMIGLVSRSTVPSDYVFQDQADLSSQVDPMDEAEVSSHGTRPSGSRPAPLFFRMFKPRAEFRAEISGRDREVTVEMESYVRIDQAITEVTQKLRYQVDYQPVTELTLMVPKALQEEMSAFTLHGKPLSTTFTSEPLSVTSVTEDSAAESDTSHRLGKIVLELPHAMEGQIEVEVSYRLPSGPWQVETTVPLRVPLFKPLETITACRVHVSPSAGLQASLQPAQGDSSSSWSPVRISAEMAEDISQKGASPASAESALLLTSSEAMQVLPLVVQIDPVQQQDQTTLERVWLQTWLLGSMRQERAALRFRTKQPKVDVQLPSLGFHPQVEVLLDRQPVVAQWTTDDRLSIPINSGKRQTAHTLEIRYQVPFSAVPWFRFRIVPVQIECPLSGVPVFWQLVLPKHYFVASSPAQLAGEYWLGWKNYQWGRQPTKFQPEFEQWSGAVSLQDPSPSFNQYLYSSFEAPRSIQVSLVSKTWLVFVSSAAMFCAGLMLLTTSLGRSPIFWFMLSLSALLMVLARPETAMVVVAGILVGGGLTLFSILLQRMLLGANGQAALSGGGGSALGRETRSTEPWLDQSRPSSAAEQVLTTSLHVSEPAP